MVLFVAFNIVQCLLVLMATIISMHLHEAEQKHSAVKERPHKEIDEPEREPTSGWDNNIGVFQPPPKVLSEDRNEEKSNGIISECNAKVHSNEAISSSSKTWLPADVTDIQTNRYRVVMGESLWRMSCRKISRFLTRKENTARLFPVSANALDRCFFFIFFSFSAAFFCSIFNI